MLYKHGATVGGKPSRIYRIWVSMRQRTKNPHNSHYKYYGGKGISVCIEWDTYFLIFYDWAMANGYTDKLTIDRIDGDGNYCPENCRWVTPGDNTRNQKHRDDYGIFPKKNGFYVQIIYKGVYFCGGFSTDITKVRAFRDNLITKIRNGLILSDNDIERKKMSRDKKTGRIIWK